MDIIIILAIGLLLIIFLVIGLLIFDSKRNNIRLYFKEPVNNNFLFHTRKARFKKDSNGQEFYVATKKINGKKYFPIPESSKSTHLDGKGKKNVFGYISSHGEVVYSVDENTNLFTHEEHIKKIQPFTSNQRALYINQNRKALEDANKGWKQNIAVIASGIVLVVILIISMVIFNNIYKNNKELSEVQLQITEKQVEIYDKWGEIEADIQQIKQQVTNNNGDVEA